MRVEGARRPGQSHACSQKATLVVETFAAFSCKSLPLSEFTKTKLRARGMATENRCPQLVRGSCASPAVCLQNAKLHNREDANSQLGALIKPLRNLHTVCVSPVHIVRSNVLKRYLLPNSCYGRPNKMKHKSHPRNRKAQTEKYTKPALT